MKIRVLIPLALMALLMVPTASADEPVNVSNPLEALYAWVSSMWDALASREGDRAEGEPAAESNEDPGPLPALGPWIEPHG